MRKVILYILTGENREPDCIWDFLCFFLYRLVCLLASAAGITILLLKIYRKLDWAIGIGVVIPFLLVWALRGFSFMMWDRWIERREKEEEQRMKMYRQGKIIDFDLRADNTKIQQIKKTTL